MANEVKEKVEEVVETVKEEVTSKKKTWVNRIWSAVVGAVVAVGAMFGVTQPQIEAQKAKVTELKTYAIEALDAIKSGDVTTATEKLKQATATTKEVAEQIKKDVEKVKNADKNSVVETAKNAATEALVKDQVKKVETAGQQYTNEQKPATTVETPVKK